MNNIIARIEREAGVPGLISILAERVTPTDLQSLLLAVYRRRTSRLQPSAVLSSYENDRFVRPSAVSPVELLKWEQAAYAHLPPEFELLALSPLCPLGTNSVAAGVNQDWSVATARNTEVVSDSTGVLALECAVRRRALLRANPKSAEPVRMAATHRLLRAQNYKDPHASAHFSLLALCSAGRDQGGLRFELAELGPHIRYYLRTLRAYLGSAVPLHLTVTDFRPEPRHDLLEAQLLAPVQSEFAGIDCAFDDERTAGRGYYLDLCFHIYGTAASGQRFLLVDGGCVNWTQKYLSNARERLITSGIGSERVCAEFKS